MAEQDLDRTHAASPYKLQKARERGQVAKSADVVSAIVFTVAVVYLYWKGWDGLRAQFAQDHVLLSHAGAIDASPATLWRLVASMVMGTALLLGPFFGVVMLSALVGNLVQTGFVLSSEPLKPDFQRLNPVQGFKKVFAVRTLFDTGRALAKLFILALVVYFALKELVPQFFQVAALPPAGLARLMVQDAASAGLKVALALGLIALVDLGFTRRQFGKQMRMSRKEVTDEHKHREGDPRIKSRIRELRRELLKRSQAVRNTAGADVLITNPTHIAVALRYEQGAMSSPELVAKGAGLMATAMRRIAAVRGIPVVQNRLLARALYHELAVTQSVPPAHYKQVARILVWVLTMRRPRAGGAA